MRFRVRGLGLRGYPLNRGARSSAFTRRRLPESPQPSGRGGTRIKIGSGFPKKSGSVVGRGTPTEIGASGVQSPSLSKPPEA